LNSHRGGAATPENVPMAPEAQRRKNGEDNFGFKKNKDLAFS
jgi:hypothetical protein